LTQFEVFARGGYATVYRAVQQSVGREVAVKVENRTLDSSRDQARFLREARAAGRMSSHPHVVDLFDAGVTPDQHPYLIMELCDGSYAERMRTSPLDALEARDLGVKIADALAHAHAAGVLHRDVKPANILHSHFNSALLADFGLAILVEARDSSVTLEVLTPAYAPPEMFSHHKPSPAVDVYALCATLYAVMHGKPPRWQSDRNPSLVTLVELFQQPVPGLPGVPDALVDVLRAGMSNDPGARPSAAELRDLLAAVPLGPVTASPVSGPPVPAAPVSGPPAPVTPVSAAPSSGVPLAGNPVSGVPAVSSSGPRPPTGTVPGPGARPPGPPVPTQPGPGRPVGVPGQPVPVPGQVPPVAGGVPRPAPGMYVSGAYRTIQSTTPPGDGGDGWRVLRWVLIILAAVALLVVVGFVSWYAGRHPGLVSSAPPAAGVVHPAAPAPPQRYLPVTVDR
jgi:serine/threonine protein kinase